MVDNPAADFSKAFNKAVALNFDLNIFSAWMDREVKISIREIVKDETEKVYGAAIRKAVREGVTTEKITEAIAKQIYEVVEGCINLPSDY